MEALLLARWQFAITSVYHFLFVPLTLGLSVLVAALETLYVKTGDERYRQLTKFWGKLFLINFAMGVVTGIVQEFHFGMNWSEYSRFMGDIFGAPLALEALTAFFLESTFLGLWVFGWERLSKKLHLACIWLVAFASNLSAFWILAANSFMQHPVGYAVRNGRAEMTDFSALITNPYVLPQYMHTVLSGVVTAGVFMLSISAYYLLKRRHVELFRASFKLGLIWLVVGALAVMGSGHLSAQSIGKFQPMKLAAAEALWDSADPAPFTVVASIDESRQANTGEIQVPGLLSMLAYDAPRGEVKGLKDLQAEYSARYGAANYIPDVTALFWSFRLMVAAGLIMAVVAIIAAILFAAGRLEQYPLILRLALCILPLPYLANSAGWYVAEGGRQPWIVVGLQKVSEAASPNVTSAEIWISMIGFTLVYAVLAAAAVWLIVKMVKQGPVDEKQNQAPKAEKGAAALWN